MNVVPGEAHFSLDLRGEFDDTRDHTWAEISSELDAIMGRRGLRWRAREVHSAPAVFCAPLLQDVVRAGIGADAPTLFSRAGHDAMSIGAITGVGMLFLRNPDGISHHPDEAVTGADVAAGLRALAEAVLHSGRRCAEGAPRRRPWLRGRGLLRVRQHGRRSRPARVRGCVLGWAVTVDGYQGPMESLPRGGARGRTGARK